MKIVNSAKVFDPRVNPRMTLSAESLMLISEVIETPVFSEVEINELIHGVTSRQNLEKLWIWLKKGGSGEQTPSDFFRRLGLAAENLNVEEKENLKLLLKKFLKPGLRGLVEERTKLSEKINSLNQVIRIINEPSSGRRKNG